MADVYRGKVKAERSFFNLLLYLSMFPKMMQGPIVRYEQVARQLMDRRTTPRAAFEGAQRFIIGLAKKVLLADYAGKVVASLSTGGGNGTFVGAWLAALMFMFQIYFDFSGYSDMAIGLGRIFGFRYCENFDLPYISTSITEFWRRWHMSLGSFFRDYVVYPARRQPPRQGSPDPQPAGCVGTDGPVARRKLELCAVGPVFLRAAVHRKADRPEAGNAPVYRAQPRDDVLCAHRLGAVHEYVALRHRLGICRHVRRRNELRWLRCFAAAQKLAAAAPDLPHRFVRASALVRLSLERPVRHGAFRPPRRL